MYVAGTEKSCIPDQQVGLVPPVAVASALCAKKQRLLFRPIGVTEV